MSKIEHLWITYRPIGFCVTTFSCLGTLNVTQWDHDASFGFFVARRGA